jgi:hypothetical protein
MELIKEFIEFIGIWYVLAFCVLLILFAISQWKQRRELKRKLLSVKFRTDLPFDEASKLYKQELLEIYAPRPTGQNVSDEDLKRWQQKRQKAYIKLETATWKYQYLTASKALQKYE